MKVPRQALSAAICLLILSLLALDAAAAPSAGASTTCQPYGTTNACRWKRVDNLSINWNAGVSSYTTNPVTDIGVIGWPYWTIRETCSGAITMQEIRDPSIRTNASSHTRLESFQKQGCGGTRVGWSMGNHDFHQFGYEHIYPPKQYSEPLP